MAQPMVQRSETDPVFWWWDTERGAQVVVLTDEFLILSDVLTKRDLGMLEAARKAGTVISTNFGAGARTVVLDDVRRVRFVPTQYRVLVDLVSQETPFVVDPPKASAGVAAGLFDVLNKLLTPAETIENSSGPMSVGTKLSLMLAGLTQAFVAGALIQPVSLIGAWIAAGAFGFVILTGFGAATNALIPSGTRVLEFLVSPGQADAVHAIEPELPAVTLPGPIEPEETTSTAPPPSFKPSPKGSPSATNEAVSTANEASDGVSGAPSHSSQLKGRWPTKSASPSVVHSNAPVRTPKYSGPREPSPRLVKAPGTAPLRDAQAATGDHAIIKPIDSNDGSEVATSPTPARTREFNKVVDPDAPRPAWSTAPEPTDESVSPEVAERARPVKSDAAAAKPSPVSD